MAGADGLEFQEDISLRRLRLGERTVLTLLSPYHGRSVWNCGREHRIETGAGSSAFLSPFGMTSTRRREDADHDDSGASGLRGVLIMLRSTERSLSNEYHAKSVLPPQYVTERSRHSGRTPLTRKSGMRNAQKIVARFRSGKPERKKSTRRFMRHDQTDNPCATARRVLRGMIAPVLR